MAKYTLAHCGSLNEKRGNKMSVKIYLSGKITGDPDYKAKFEEAEQFAKKYVEGSVILNPAVMPTDMLWST